MSQPGFSLSQNQPELSQDYMVEYQSQIDGMMLSQDLTYQSQSGMMGSSAEKFVLPQSSQFSQPYWFEMKISIYKQQRLTANNDAIDW